MNNEHYTRISLALLLDPLVVTSLSFPYDDQT